MVQSHPIPTPPIRTKQPSAAGLFFLISFSYHRIRHRHPQRSPRPKYSVEYYNITVDIILYTLTRRFRHVHKLVKTISTVVIFRRSKLWLIILSLDFLLKFIDFDLPSSCHSTVTFCNIKHPDD